SDDELTLRYLEGEEIGPDELKEALRRAANESRLVPVLCGSALKNKGVQLLLDAVIAYLPSPLEVPPVKGLEPGDDEWVERPTEEDPTFKVRTDEDSGQVLISGMGELHLEVILDRMFREYKVEANRGKPQVAYKETITQPVRSRGLFKRQTGGRGMFGDVTV